MFSTKVLAARRSILHLKNVNALSNVQVRNFTVTKKFTKTHEWIEFDDSTNIATIGITDHAQAELGDIVHVDLPEEGQEFSKSEVIVCVESVKTAADIYQMVDGEVVEINEQLAEDASLLNSDAEGKGWIMKVKLSDSTQMNDLLSADKYKHLL